MLEYVLAVQQELIPQLIIHERRCSQENISIRSMNHQLISSMDSFTMTNGRYIITEDSDFGKGDTEKAEHHADVLHYLTNQMQLTVHDAKDALSIL